MKSTPRTFSGIKCFHEIEYRQFFIKQIDLRVFLKVCGVCKTTLAWNTAVVHDFAISDTANEQQRITAFA